VNPAAGGGLAAEVADAVAGHLRMASEVEVVVAADAADTARAAAEVVADGVDVIAVLGGDGVAHVAVQACAGTSTALAVIPTGTGNDLARALGMPLEPVAAARQAAQRMAEGVEHRMDLGRIAGANWFATVLCAGFDSMVNARVNRMRWPRGKRCYDLAALRELVDLRAMPLWVEADGDEFELDATLVAVGNTSCYGGGIPVCPDADPGDGELDLTIVGQVSRLDLLRIFPTLRTGRHVDHPAVRTMRARSVRLGGDNGWLSFGDGEPQARLPLTASCEPGALRVVRSAL
jgi:diacylglycerol kinase (ATP)